MTKIKMMKELIESSNQALCDNCLKELLGFNRSQQANGYAHTLSERGEIKRSEDKEQCDRCKADKLVNKCI